LLDLQTDRVDPHGASYFVIKLKRRPAHDLNRKSSSVPGDDEGGFNVERSKRHPHLFKARVDFEQVLVDRKRYAA